MRSLNQNRTPSASEFHDKHHLLSPPPAQAITKYQKLACLLRGEFPAGMLPTPPDGYVASRIQDLASKKMVVRMHSTAAADGRVGSLTNHPLAILPQMARA